MMVTEIHADNIYSSLSSASWSAMLKYRSSYTLLSLFDAITRSQSLTLCFLRYFFVRYFKYLFDIATSDEIITLVFSRVTDTESPKTPVLPSTLILSCRNFSNDEISMILSSTGLEQSITKLNAFLPFGAITFVFDDMNSFLLFLSSLLIFFLLLLIYFVLLPLPC